MNTLTPLLTVEAIEPLLPFWRDALELEVTVSVPHPPEREDGPLGFVMLARGPVSLMLQTRQSVEADLEGAGETAGYPDLAGRMADALPVLFARVDALDPVLDRIRSVAGEPRVAIPRRTTFYGMDEVFLMAPGGALLGLAAPVAEGG